MEQDLNEKKSFCCVGIRDCYLTISLIWFVLIFWRVFILFPAAAVSLGVKKCNKEMQMCLQLSPSRCEFLLL